MMAFGFAEILMLALVSGGINSTDLVDLVQPTHYFQYRQWEPSADKMADLAGEDPKDAKGQIAQLTCLRYLAAETAALKKSPRYAEHRQALEAIAQGKKAQDSLGFAKEYANRVLLKLDNAKPAAVKFPPVREDSLNWFPANATLVGAVDLRQARSAGGADPLKDLLKLMPDREKEQMYQFVEKSGNVRIERAAFAYVEGTGKRDGKIFARITGKGNQDWMVAAFNMIDGGRGRMQIKVSKDEKGTRITLIQPQNGPPVIMLVGNTDLLVVGYQGNNGQQDDLVTEVLDVRSKKKARATTGPLKDRLAKIPDKAVALLVGEAPDDMKRELGRVFDPMPTKLTAFIERAQQGLDVHVESSTANAQDAGKLVRKIGDLRKEGIKRLQDEMQQPQRPGAPPIPFQALINLLETVQVQSKDDNVQVRIFVPDALIRQIIPATFMPRNIGGVEKIEIKN